MITIHSCKCGQKWQLETHDSEGSYSGLLACAFCKRLIVTWQGPFFYTVKKEVEGQEQSKKAKAASK